MIALKYVKIPDLPDFQDYDLTRKVIICGLKSERNPDSIELLQNILRAVNISMNTEVQVLWLEETQEIKLNVLTQDQNPRWVLAFGILPKQLGFNMEVKLNTTVRLAYLSLLFTSPFMQLKQTKMAKKQLWEVLKINFVHE